MPRKSKGVRLDPFLFSR